MWIPKLRNNRIHCTSMCVFFFEFAFLLSVSPKWFYLRVLNVTVPLNATEPFVFLCRGKRGCRDKTPGRGGGWGRALPERDSAARDTRCRCIPCRLLFMVRPPPGGAVPPATLGPAPSEGGEGRGEPGPRALTQAGKLQEGGMSPFPGGSSQ